ncbi:hypothetical protein ACHRVZ_19915 [Flavobacterium sp. FlaQc-57]|uniref:hypothetical protein n=1 Tax=Flavobacterium sp. FlaQc-57 TaxID=3374186 RepID=UPI0037564B53
MKTNEEVKISSKLTSFEKKFVTLTITIKKRIIDIIMKAGLFKYKYKFALK